MINTDTFHWAIILLLIAGIGINVWFGCRCHHRHSWREGFTDAPSEETVDDALTPKERELFSDLVKDKLDDHQIVKMVKNNVLTEQLVEKFLNKLSKDSDKKEEKEIETFDIGPNSSGLAAFAAPI